MEEGEWKAVEDGEFGDRGESCGGVRGGRGRAEVVIASTKDGSVLLKV